MLRSRSEHKNLEFKYSLAQEKIQELQKELKSKETARNMLSDAAIQTDYIYSSNDQWCQTDSLERKNFQSQTSIKSSNQTTVTETNGEAEDLQLRFNIQLSNRSEVQTIKQEIAMPNIPTSVGQTRSNKRKISSISTSISTTNKSNDDTVIEIKQEPESQPTVSIPTAAGPGSGSTSRKPSREPRLQSNRIPAAPSSNEFTPEELEKVKKCKNFLFELIQLARRGHEHTNPRIVQNVEELVQQVIDDLITPNDFTERLKTELHPSKPPGNLVPFLLKSLPLLRRSMRSVDHW